MGYLSNSHLFPIIPEMQNQSTGKIQFLKRTLFLDDKWLPSHCIKWQSMLCSLFLFLKGHWCHHGNSTFMTSSKPDYLPKVLLLNIIVLGLGIEHMNFGRPKCIHSNSPCIFGLSSWVYVSSCFLGRGTGLGPYQELYSGRR